MEKRSIPRVVITAPASGSGKTMFTTVLLHHMKMTGQEPVGYKCGPDYIDPMFHKKVTGVPCRNLDPFFLSGTELKNRLCASFGTADMAVLEGVMGYYDGGRESELSTWAVAKATQSPVILVVDAKGSAITSLAVACGIAGFHKDSNIAGVIFNRMHQTTYEQVARLHREGNYPFALLGYIPVLPKQCQFESRHLGLVTPEEITDLKDIIATAHEKMKDSILWDKISEIANAAVPLAIPKQEAETPKASAAPTLYVARDDAFCFYYEDHFDLLRQAGCQIRYFSPLNDEALPEDACGVWLGGGYPELYLQKLRQNQTTQNSIRRAYQKKMPIIAECGGFMYLNQMIEGTKMCGCLAGEVTKKERLVRFGYVTLTAQKDSLILKKGQSLRAHEFHYYDSTDNGEDFVAQKQNGTSYLCAFATDTLYAGFPHLYFGNDPACAKRICEAMSAYQKENGI